MEFYSISKNAVHEILNYRPDIKGSTVRTYINNVYMYMYNTSNLSSLSQITFQIEDNH